MSDQADHPARLRLEGISKSFGGIHALEDVGFAVSVGAIHALLGENGAGKSTLVKILTGVYPPDSGLALLDGVPCHFRSPMEARQAGVVAVYQDPKVFPHLDVAENIFMGIHPVSVLGTVDRRRMHARARELLAGLGVELDPSSLVAGLSIGEIQFVEFARAMTQGEVRLLILDEPTAALTPGETRRLFDVVRRLRARGCSVIFISHRIEELAGLVDTVTVLRDGRHVATLPAVGLVEADVVRLMVGREVGQAASRSRVVGAERLRVEKLGLAGSFDDISFTLHTNEIVGLAGLVGAGRSEIAQTIFGVTRPTAGRLFVNGRAVQVRRPRQMLSLGVAYVPEDRDHEGLITPLSITRNLVLPIQRRLARAGMLRPAAERRLARSVAADLRIRAASVDQPVASLSGGNRQKVVLGKWLGTNPSVLILDEPTHGIDVGAKAQVHELIERLAGDGMAILMISSDLPELLRLADRILVVTEGRITCEFARKDATQEAIMHAATTPRRRAAA
ncbi:MAG TPA: sugar ABC transporter ATP-binding protein [Acetobacteraceae bacterium]|nr:sugar ABC transporter ATP-binding protein [Acetobacteraceae bacterium]